MAVHQRMRIGDLLVESGVLSAEQLQQALSDQKELKMRLGDVLLHKEYITEQQLMEVLEFQLGIPHVQLYRQNIDHRIVNLITQKQAEQYNVLPFRMNGNHLVVAMSDPLDYFAIDELRMTTGYNIEPVLASKESLQRAIERHYSLQESVDEIMQVLPESELAEEQVTHIVEESDSPVVRTVNQIIKQAVNLGASDIHIDPQSNSIKVRFRIDGLIRTEQILAKDMFNVIVARIKIMARLNVAERRKPQDGHVEMEIDFRRIDIRISILPTIHGEKIVMRILDMSQSLLEIDKLDFSEHNFALFQKGINSTTGILLVTGPTGSGKTTTLYAAMAELNDDEVNIVTVEDPVEYQLDGINQVQVNPQAGLTFANGLRSILRQDPNIVIVGEIRDRETAEISVRTAMTGHLVLSTLHTNSAVNSISRLIDMGIEPFLLSSALNCIVTQRLIRRICTHCKIFRQPSEEELAFFKKYGFDIEQMAVGRGCEQCMQSGYSGRMGIHEVLMIDDELRAMIIQKRTDSEYLAYVKTQGFIPMLEDGLTKVVQGYTTVEEVLRVTNYD